MIGMSRYIVVCEKPFGNLSSAPVIACINNFFIKVFFIKKNNKKIGKDKCSSIHIKAFPALEGRRAVCSTNTVYDLIIFRT